MGPQNSSPGKEKSENLNRGSFEFHQIIGRGGFGRVWQVSVKKTKKIYAMKEMSKLCIIDKKSERSVKAERDLLSKMNHPFIINMHYAFQDTDNLYLALEFLQGGDLRYHICKQRRFNEEQTKFFVACILLGLEYCHYHKIIHRDLKPENLVLDKNGYVHITDFGIAKIQQPNNAKETSGTPGYMSPEVMFSQDHTTAVDYYAVGVIAYEFMTGLRPYLGRSRKEIKEKIIAKQVRLKEDEIPQGWSLEAADCINLLIQRKAPKRIGSKGTQEVKDHPWFRGFNWHDLYNKKLLSPFPIVNVENYDKKYCNIIEKQGLKTQERYIDILQRKDFQSTFDDYYYFNLEEMNKTQPQTLFLNPHIRMYSHESSIIKSNTMNSMNNQKIARSNSAINYPSHFDMQANQGVYSNNIYIAGKKNKRDLSYSNN